MTLITSIHLADGRLLNPDDPWGERLCVQALHWLNTGQPRDALMRQVLKGAVIHAWMGDGKAPRNVGTILQ